MLNSQTAFRFSIIVLGILVAKGRLSARWAVEECFQDLKEIWRVGKHPVRSVWSNLAC